MEKPLKILSAHLENFGSYETLDFDFQNQGLTLIQGPTGAGKSTLMDAIPWILFGATSKGGKVDEVLSWPGDKEIYGELVINLNEEICKVHRRRGNKAHFNDLHFRLGSGSIFTPPIRGKDLQDTQKLINQRLGITVDLYLSGAYYHEFSQTSQFFITTPKIRRNICEQIVDLSLPTRLQEKAILETKTLKTKLQDVTTNIRGVESSLASLKTMQAKELTRRDDWEKTHSSELSMLKKSVSDFELALERRIQEAETKPRPKTCPTCGQTTTVDHIHKVIETLHNPYLAALEIALTKTNPHAGATQDYTEQITEDEYHFTLLKDKQKVTAIAITDLNLLQDVIAEFRSILITNTILQVEDKTNNLLSEYFNGELRLLLDITMADKLEVTITKDGNECSYTQLSKGQRQLLKLCFSVSVMQTVSNNSGISFDSIFFDEALDGLDDTFKLKALRLLESLTLQYGSIFFIEHSETIKAAVNSKYEVLLVNGKSQIQKV